MARRRYSHGRLPEDRRERHADRQVGEELERRSRAGEPGEGHRYLMLL